MKTIIHPEQMTPEVLRGVEAAARLLEKRLGVLEHYDIVATWRGGVLDGKQHVVFLDLSAFNEGREYAVKDYAYSVSAFLDPNLKTLPGLADQQIAFADELRRLNRDVRLAQEARLEAFDSAGVP